MLDPPFPDPMQEYSPTERADESSDSGDSGRSDRKPLRTFNLRGPSPRPVVSWILIIASFLGILLIMRAEPKGTSIPSVPGDAAAQLQSRVQPPSILEMRFLELFAKADVAGQLSQISPDYAANQARQFGIRLETPEAQLRLGILKLWLQPASDAPNEEALQHFARAIELWRVRNWKPEWAVPMWKGGIDYNIPRPDGEPYKFVSNSHSLPDSIKSPSVEPPDDTLQDEIAQESLTGDFDQMRVALMQMAAFRTQPDDQAKQTLQDRLEWFGELAIGSTAGANDPARRAAFDQAQEIVHLMAILGWSVLLIVLAGFVCFVTAIVLRIGGHLRFRLAPNRLFTEQSAAVFLEAFAAYFVSIAALSFLLHVVGLSNSTLGIAPIVVGSVLGVIWPYLRGLPRSRAAFEVGFSSGQGIVREIACGIFAYFAGVPIYIAGILVTLLLMVLWSAIQLASGQAPEPQPFSHPAIEGIASGNTVLIIGFFLLAVAFAPFFEETMFRGTLYGSLRKRMSVLPSALLMSFIFAAIHPQGFLAVPALMSLAFVFAMMREWRGSLVASMTAHALHNGMLVTASILVLSS